MTKQEIIKKVKERQKELRENHNIYLSTLCEWFLNLLKDLEEK